MKKLLFIFLLIPNLIIAQSDYNTLYSRAWDLFNTGEYLKSAQLFEKASELIQDKLTVYVNIASAYANAGDSISALKYLQLAANDGYIDIDFIKEYFPEFNNYYKLQEWKIFVSRVELNQKNFILQCDSIPLPTLQLQQYYNDFDTLVNTIKTYSPHFYVRQIVCGLNPDKKFAELRSEISTCKSVEDFSLILNRALTYCQDGHTSFYVQSPMTLYTDGYDINTVAYNYKYRNNFRQHSVQLSGLPSLVYFKGNYYTLNDYKFENELIKSKTQLVSINGFEPRQYIINNLDKMYLLNWDFEKKQFYSEYLLAATNSNIDTSIVLEFSMKKKNKKFVLPLKYRELITVTKATPEQGYVFYIESSKTLFINIPEMEESGFYIESILKYADKPINSVIIDVRNNPGGSDYVWQEILQTISSDSVIANLEMGLNKANLNRNPKSKYRLYEKLPQLNFDFQNSHTGYNHDKRQNLEYAGKIHVFYNQETFSAAGSLVNLCFYSDKLVAVGVKTGRILGFGTMPDVYSLPNSKLLYRIESFIDLTNVNTYRDIFHDTPEIAIDMNLDEVIQINNAPKITPDNLANDIYLKQILKINK